MAAMATTPRVTNNTSNDTLKRQLRDSAVCIHVVMYMYPSPSPTPW